MEVLKRIHSILRFLLKYIAIFLNLSIMGLILIDVAARYIFNQSYAEASELTLILAMWLYMLGAVIASDHNTHLRVEIFGLLFKGKKDGRPPCNDCNAKPGNRLIFYTMGL